MIARRRGPQSHGETLLECVCMCTHKCLRATWLKFTGNKLQSHSGGKALLEASLSQLPNPPCSLRGRGHLCSHISFPWLSQASAWHQCLRAWMFPFLQRAAQAILVARRALEEYWPPFSTFPYPQQAGLLLRNLLGFLLSSFWKAQTAKAGTEALVAGLGPSTATNSGFLYIFLKSNFLKCCQFF